MREEACSPSSENGPTKLLPQEKYSASQHQGTECELCLYASVLYLDLFCASVSKVCPGGIATPPFQLMKVFIGIFWRVGDTCIPI